MSLDSAPDRKVSPATDARNRESEQVPVRWRALLGWAAGAQERLYVLSDLQEEFARLAGTLGRRRARRWYAAQALRSTLHFARYRAARLLTATPIRGLAMHFLSDVHSALRQLLRAPVAGFAVVLTMALGAGATTAVLATVEGILFRPLPFPDSDRLVWIHTGSVEEPRASNGSNPADFLDWLGAASIEAGVAWTPPEEVTIATGGDPWRGRTIRIGDGAGRVLGLPAVAGRWFQPEEFVPNSEVAILTHEAWRRAFGRDPGAVGRTVLLDDRPVRIVGVVPDLADVFPAAAVDIWRPEPANATARGNLYLQVAARLRQGVTLERAGQEIGAVQRHLAEQFPESNANRRAWVQPYLEGLVGSVTPMLLLIGGTVGLVLLIACGNVASILLALAAARGREFALRSAIGGTAARLTAQVVTEVLVLAGLGLLLGLAVAPFLLRALVSLYPGTLPRSAAVSLSPLVLLAASGATLLAALAAATPVVRQARRGDLGRALRTGDRGGMSRGAHRVSGLLVGGQVAMAVVLLFAGVLLLRTLYTLAERDPGFDRTGLVAFSLAPTPARYATNAEAYAYLHRVAERVGAVPGVRAAGFTTLLPYHEGNLSTAIWPQGVTRSMETATFPVTHGVSAGYLETLGLPLREGRRLRPADPRGPPVAVVSAGLAERLWPGQPAVGHRIESNNWAVEVVGVVGDKRHRSLRDDPPLELYVPREQTWFYSRAHWIVARVTGSPATATPALLAAAREVDPGTPPARASTLEDRIARSLAPERFRGVLVGSLGGLALLLTVVGIWGTVAHLVSRRIRRENPKL